MKIMLRRGKIIPKDLCRAFTETPYKLLILLVIVDLVFIFLHILTINTDLLHDRLFLIDKDRSYTEVYQYIKEFWIVILLLYIAIKRPSYLLFAWFLVFTYILIDDAIRFHEQFGAVITSYFGFTAALGLPGRQFGQFVIAAMIGTLIVIVLGTSYSLSGRKFRNISNSLLFLLVAFFFFSFFVDLIHEFFRKTELDSIIAVIEDGGEMLVMSVIAWYVFYLEPESGDRVIE